MGCPEFKIENYLRRRVKEADGEIRKCKWIGRRGAPDNFVWFSGGRFALVECKAVGESVDWRSLQGREIRRMRDDGLPVFVVGSYEEVDAAIKTVLAS